MLPGVNNVEIAVSLLYCFNRPIDAKELDLLNFSISTTKSESNLINFGMITKLKVGFFMFLCANKVKSQSFEVLMANRVKC